MNYQARVQILIICPRKPSGRRAEDDNTIIQKKNFRENFVAFFQKIKFIRKTDHWLSHNQAYREFKKAYRTLCEYVLRQNKEKWADKADRKLTVRTVK